MRTYYAALLPPLNILDGGAFNTFTAFQSISPAPGVVLPANLLEPGSEISIEAEGEFSNTGTPTLGLGFFYGTAAVVLAQGTPLTTITTAVSWPWSARWVGRVRAVGSAGSIQGQGYWSLGISLTQSSVLQNMPATLALRTVAINTTAASQIGVGASWGTSSVSNTIKCTRLSVELRS
jgi:hypothetical protein